MRFEGKQVLVIGLGESGRAAAQFFLSRGAIVTAVDERPLDQLGECSGTLASLGVRIHAGGHWENLFATQDLIVPSPGVPWDLPELERARTKGVTVAGELQVAASYLQGRVVGVTGTNGKTTTVSLIGHILETTGRKVSTGGNIGRPVLSMVETATADTWNVLELSSFQLEATTNFRSNIGVVLNVTPDHLDRHGTFKSYCAAKYRIVETQTREDVLVANMDDRICRQFADSCRGNVTWFSQKLNLDKGVCVQNGWITCGGIRVADTTLPIRGKHNLENALAAIAACWQAGVSIPQITESIETFRPVEHRLEFVRNCKGVDYYNDSKATNVDAAVKSIESFNGGLWVILGGKDKSGDYKPLRSALGNRAHAGLLIGASARKIGEQLTGSIETQNLETLEQAVACAHAKSRPGDTVLLAPACASFDQFKNYEERGNRFKDLVALL